MSGSTPHKPTTPRPTVSVDHGAAPADCGPLLRLLLAVSAHHAAAGRGAAPHVVILPDNDQPGRDHAAVVARSLRDLTISLKVVELPGLPPKGDVSDWLAAGGDKAQLLRLVQEATPWRPDVRAESTSPPE